MQTRHFFQTLAIVVALFGALQNAEAQKIKILGASNIPIKTKGGGGGTGIPGYCTCDPQNDTTGYAPVYCNTATGAESPSCDSMAVHGTLGVNFFISAAEYNYGNKIYIVGKQVFTNKSSCNENFVTCSMVQYAAPEMDQNHLDTNYGLKLDSMGDSVGLIPEIDTDAFGTSVNAWLLTENPCGACGTGCNYTCMDEKAEFRDYWSYYFGCQDINLAPGQSVTINSKAQEVDAPILATHDGGDTATKTITLSPNPANINDTSISTWNYDGMYMDFLKGCNFLSMSGCNFGDEAGQEVFEVPANYTCTVPEWYYKGQIFGAYHGRSYPIGIVAFPIGNQVTSNTFDTTNIYTVHPAEFIGSLIGAPAGSELIVYAPENTSGGAAVIDSGWVWTDTIGDCKSDTLGFEFPFVIPPPQYLDRGMTFMVKFPPDSCSNVGNGKRIYLNGQVVANATTPLYDSGAFMYNAQGTMILDTTPPVITNFIVTPVDSTHLAINLTGVDDTTEVNIGYVIYTINGGPEQIMPLNYADSTNVGDTTTFIDTLVSPVSHPSITIKGFVGNELGLLDSSGVTIVPLKANPQGVTTQQGESLRVNYLMIDHQSKTLTLDLQADREPIELDLVTENGQLSKLTSESSSPDGEQKFIQSLSNFANGAYFLVIRSGNDSIIENIIL